MEKIKLNVTEKRTPMEESETKPKTVFQESFEAVHEKTKKVLEEVAKGKMYRTFKKAGGGYKTHIFGSAINYYDEQSGRYRNSDTGLVKNREIDEVIDFAGFENKTAGFTVRFAENLDGKKIYTIKKDKYSATVSLEESNSVSASIETQKGNQKLVYQNYADGIDLEYEVCPNHIKEYIVYKKQLKQYDCKFSLKLNNLKPEVGENGKELHFISVDTEKVIFTIPAPNMKDAEGNVREEIYYDITAVDATEYTFRVIADANWLNAKERKFPVAVDPSIYNSEDEKYFEIYTLYSGNAGLVESGDASTVYKFNSYMAKIWIRFHMQKLLPENAVIRSAVLHLRKTDIIAPQNKSPIFTVKRITDATGASSGNYSKLKVDDEYLDIINAEEKETRQPFTIDVTKAVRTQEDGEKGVLIEVLDTSLGDQGLSILTPFSIADQDLQPYLDVDYYVPEEFNGGEGYSVAINERCNYSLNLYSGTELLEYEDVSMSGNRLPLRISHIYNGLNQINNYIKVGTTKVLTGLPCGWKLNLQQYLYSEGSGAEQKYVYIDQAGFRHNLYRHLKVEATPSGSSYTFDADNYEFRDDSIGMKYIGSNKLMDNQGTVYIFTGRYLTQIVDKNGNTLNITYGSNDCSDYVIKSVTDGCGRKANFIYVYGYLTEIGMPDGTKLQYNIAGASKKTLEGIVNPDGTETKFSYYGFEFDKISDSTGYFVNIERFSDNKKYVFKDGTAVRTIRQNQIETFCENYEEDDINTTNTVYLNEGYAKLVYENETETYYKFDTDGVCVNKFTFKAGDRSKAAAYEGVRTEKNMSYRFSSLPQEENLIVGGDCSMQSGGLDHWFCPNNNAIQWNDRITLPVTTGETMYIRQTVSDCDLDDLRADEGFVVSALVSADKYCLPSTEESAARFCLEVSLKYLDSSKDKTRTYYFDSNIDTFQFGTVPISADECTGLDKIYVKVDYSHCYNNGITALCGEDTESDLKVYHVSLSRCKMSKTVTGPTFFNGEHIYGAGDVKKVLYGSSSYTVNISDAEDLSSFMSDISAMLSNPGYVFKNGETIASEVDLSTIKLQGSVETSEKTNSFNDNLFSLEYGPQGYMETKSAAGTSRSWSDAQGLIRRSVFINPKGEEFHVFYYYDIHGNLVKVQDEKLGDRTEYGYNSYGTVIKETVGNEHTSDKLIYESRTDTSGYYTVKEYDERYSDEDCNEIYTQSAYDSYKGQLKKVTMPNGQAYNYGYGADGMLNSVSAGFLTRDGNSVRYSQNENVEYEYNAGLLTKIDRTGAVYEFEYDGYSRIKKVTLNGVTVYTAAYNKTADGKSYTNVSYGNGWTGEEVSDEYGRFIEKSVTKDGVKQTLASAEYDEDTMLLKSLTDSACGSGKTTKMTYVYDEHGETAAVRYTGYRIGEYSQETDSEGYVTKTTYEKNIGETQTYKYLYEKYGTTSGNRVPNAPLTWLYLPTDKKIKYVYDALNRLKEKGIVTEKDEYYSELYTYEDGGYQEYTIYNRFLKNNISPFCIGGGCSGGSTGGGGETKPPVTTILPDRVTTFISQVEFRGLNLTDKYEYDKNGNISKRTIGGNEIRYTYDDIDRLIREDNAALNKTYFYEYDDFGNLEKVTTYNYTTGNSLTGGVTRTYAYDSNKRLTSVTENGVTQSISGYDALGNPSSYKGKTLTWTRGRMLASCGSDSYLYDMDGVRQEKTVNGVTHTYYTDGTKIIAEKVGDKVFEYYYDAQGVIGFKYDGNVYYYKKNLQGDIDRIYDANKNLVAEYKYDAWGNHRVYTSGGIDITENMSYNSSVAKLNPFRYRGYYYDMETGLYYLNSRYYDPSIGRFINADDISYIQPTDINGLNLFAYCGNNPVMYVDSVGTSPKWWQAILIGIGIIAVAALVATAIVYTGGGAAAFFVTAGKAALGGLKIAAVAGLTAGSVRAGSTAIGGGSIGDVGKSFVTGFADGFFSGSIYAASTMLLSASAFRISGLFNNGYGASSGAWQFGYQTPKTPGITIFTFAGGINGGSSVRFDLDMYNGLHLHYKLAEKVNNKFFKKVLGGMKRHRWMLAPILIGVGVGLSDPWSEW